MTKENDDLIPLNMAEWRNTFLEEDPAVVAKLTAQLMIAMGFYHQRMKLHIMLHPLFFLAGFIIAYGVL